MSRRYGFSEMDLSVQALEKELTRVEKAINFKRKLISTVFTLAVIISVSVALSLTVFPVLKVFGSSMEPALVEGDVVICKKTDKINAGELVAFYYGNKVLIKRCVAVSGDTVLAGENGEMFINGKKLSEPYIKGGTKGKGKSEIEYPCVVPVESIFVLSDDRENTNDSRKIQIGCVACEQIIGKIGLRIWPVERICFLL